MRAVGVRAQEQSAMAVVNGEVDEVLDGPSFTIGEPSEPVPQSALQQDHRLVAMDKGVSFDEVDYRSE